VGSDDDAVLHFVGPIALGGDGGVVGDEEKGFAAGPDEIGKEAEDAVGIFRVEVAGRFVGEDDLGVVGEGAGDSDALLFAAGEVAAGALGFGGKADGVEQFERTVHHGAFAEAAEATHGDHDVFGGGEVLEEEVELEDEAEEFVSFLGEIVIAKTGDILAIDDEGAVVGAVEESEDVEEGAFAAAGGADDGVDEAGFEAQGDGAEGVDAVFVEAEESFEAGALEAGAEGGGVHWPDPLRISTGGTREARRAGK
jgi:hypothetical protein